MVEEHKPLARIEQGIRILQRVQRIEKSRLVDQRMRLGSHVGRQSGKRKLGIRFQPRMVHKP